MNISALIIIWGSLLAFIGCFGFGWYLHLTYLIWFGGIGLFVWVCFVFWIASAMNTDI